MAGTSQLHLPPLQPPLHTPTTALTNITTPDMEFFHLPHDHDVLHAYDVVPFGPTFKQPKIVSFQALSVPNLGCYSRHARGSYVH